MKERNPTPDNETSESEGTREQDGMCQCRNSTSSNRGNIVENNRKIYVRIYVRKVMANCGLNERRRKHPTYNCPYLGSLDDEAIQQDDATKDFYMTIVNGSLVYAYRKYGPSYPIIPKTSGKSDKSVIVVGAGLSGLVAAFELEKVGYKAETLRSIFYCGLLLRANFSFVLTGLLRDEFDTITMGVAKAAVQLTRTLLKVLPFVQIIELQHRVGGRTKTLRGGFSDGLHAEGGAMRIPPNHYLTHGYIDKFDIRLRPFINYNGNGWLCLSDEQKIRIKDWEQNNKFYCDKFFPGWDANLPSTSNVEGLLDLHEKTMAPLKDDLYQKIKENGPQNGWSDWVERWSKLSVNDFLRSSTGESQYLPWTEVAIRGYQIATYSPEFDQSLVEYLRDELGEWWRKKLETPVDGIDTLAKHFIQPYDYKDNKIYLSPKITFGTKVFKIKRRSRTEVEVVSQNTFTGQETTFTAGAVIITTPLTILRQIDIDLPKDYEKAIANINYGASTKIVLQCRSRFWEKAIDKGGVGQGGFSKTNLPIGQLHYPSPNDPPLPNERGLLVCYTWGQDALIFGAQTDKEAIESAVKEVTKIHPEMETEFEVGMVQAWFSDPASQGAYALLKPYQYNSAMKTLMTPDHPIYLAGEAISYTNAWIQGALESGLNAAYHLYSNNIMPNDI